METVLNSNVETITPKIAEQMLATAGPNRVVNAAAVQRHADAMRNGGWALNGESIIFDDTGCLMDGQHRLSAVVLSGCTVQAMVVRGAESESFMTIDTGTKRAAGQMLGIAGYKYANIMAAGLRLLLDYNHNRLLKSRIGYYSHNDILKAAEDHPNFARSAAAASKFKLPGILTSSIISFCYYLFAQRDVGAATDFFRRLASGEMLQQGNPVLTLRRRLLKDSQSRLRGRKGQIGRRTLVKLIFRAWNAEREGRTMMKTLTKDRIPRIV